MPESPGALSPEARSAPRAPGPALLREGVARLPCFAPAPAQPAQPIPSRAWLFLELSAWVRFPPVVPHAAVQTEHVVRPNKGPCVLQTIPLSLEDAERAGPERYYFSLQFKHPISFLSAAGGRGGLSASRSTALEIAAERAPPGQGSPKPLRLPYTGRLQADSLLKDRSPGTPSGEGPGTAYSCQNVSDRRRRHSCTGLFRLQGTGSAQTHPWKGALALGLVTSCALLRSREDGAGTGRDHEGLALL